MGFYSSQRIQVTATERNTNTNTLHSFYYRKRCVENESIYAIERPQTKKRGPMNQHQIHLKSMHPGGSSSKGQPDCISNNQKSIIIHKDNGGLKIFIWTVWFKKSNNKIKFFKISLKKSLNFHGCRCTRIVTLSCTPAQRQVEKEKDLLHMTSTQKRGPKNPTNWMMILITVVL